MASAPPNRKMAIKAALATYHTITDLFPSNYTLSTPKKRAAFFRNETIIPSAEDQIDAAQYLLLPNVQPSSAPFPDSFPSLSCLPPANSRITPPSWLPISSWTRGARSWPNVCAHSSLALVRNCVVLWKRTRSLTRVGLPLPFADIWIDGSGGLRLVFILFISCEKRSGSLEGRPSSPESSCSLLLPPDVIQLRILCANLILFIATSSQHRCKTTVSIQPIEANESFNLEASASLSDSPYLPLEPTSVASRASN
jgi:hypothetical protein